MTAAAHLKPGGEDLRKLKALVAEIPSLRVQTFPHGHIQVQGGLFTVNWYPFSNGRRAYVTGATRASHEAATPERVIALAQGKVEGLVAPPCVARRRKTSGLLRKLWRIDSRCCWCRVQTKLRDGSPTAESPAAHDDATIDHRIPRSKGGSDRRDNLVLACRKCNEQRGDSLAAPSG